MNEIGIRFFEYIEQHEISQSQAAKSMRLSPGVLSSYKAGDYKGSIQNVEGKLERYLRESENKRKALKIRILPIESLRKIHDAIDIAFEEQDIAVITGSAGVGKTTALEEYVKDSFGSAILIKVNKTFTQHRLIKTLAAKLGLNTRGSAGEITDRIIEYLRENEIVVIVDEADYLSANSIEWLRQAVNDAGESGLVLVGIQRLAHQIRRDSSDHDQVLSRVGVYLGLEGTNEKDMELVIRSVYPDLEKALVKKLINMSKMRYYNTNEPSLRTLTKLLKRLHRLLIKFNREKPDAEAIDSVAGLIMRRTA